MNLLKLYPLPLGKYNVLSQESALWQELKTVLNENSLKLHLEIKGKPYVPDLNILTPKLHNMPVI